MEHPPDDAIRETATQRARAASSKASERGEDLGRMLTVQEVAERVGHWKCHGCGEQGGVQDMLVARGCNVERAAELRRWFDLLSDEEPSPGARTLRHAAAGPTKDANSTNQKRGVDVEESTVQGWQDDLENRSKAVGRPTDFGYLRRTQPTEVGARGGRRPSPPYDVHPDVATRRPS